RHWEGYERVTATGATRYGAGDVLAVPALTKDGRQISVEFTIVLLRDAEQQVAGMAAILRDVTARFEEVRRLKRQPAGRGRRPGRTGRARGRIVQPHAGRRVCRIRDVWSQLNKT